MRMRLWLPTLVAVAGLWNATALFAADTRFTAGVVNVAAAERGGHIVAFSSQALDKNGKPWSVWAPQNLIDGKFVVGNYTPKDSYGWSSNAPPTATAPQWIIFAFGPAGHDETHLISRIAIDPTTDSPQYIGRWVKNVELQVSSTTPDGPWQTVGQFLVMNKPIKQSFDFLPVEARYLKLNVLSNHGSDRCVEMGEFEAYDAIVGDETLAQLIIRLENVLNDLKRYHAAINSRQAREIEEAITSKPAPPAGAEGKPQDGKPAGPQTPATPPAGPAGPPAPGNQ